MKAFVNIGVCWSMEVTGTFEELFSLQRVNISLIEIYKICLKYVIYRHNFLLDNDNKKFNKLISDLDNSFPATLIDINTLKYYQAYLYNELRSSLNVIGKPVTLMEPVINDNNELYGVVISYDGIN